MVIRKTVPRRDRPGNLYIFARFHSKEGQEGAVCALLKSEVVDARKDPGCLAHQAYSSATDPRLFFIHSKWVDERAFENHLKLPHTLRFAQRIERLLDHELRVTRTRPIGPAMS